MNWRWKLMELFAPLPDELFNRIVFLYKQRYWPHFRSPRSYNEKINFMKLYMDDPRRGRLADRRRAREYVRRHAPECRLIPLLWEGRELSREVYDALPRRFVLKPNHGSGMVAIVDKNDMRFETLREKTLSWLSRDYGRISRQHYYSNVEKVLLAETFLDSGEAEVPTDYKFICFNGRVELIEVNSERFTGHKLNLYDRDFRPLKVRCEYPPAEIIAPPKHLNQAIAIAEKLTQGFDLLKVDLYLMEEGVYFGEFTNTPGNGFNRFSPRSFDFKLGRRLVLDPRYYRMAPPRTETESPASGIGTVTESRKRRLPRLLYIGNMLARRGNAPTVMDRMCPRLAKLGYEISCTSDRPGKIARLVDMLLTLWRERDRTECVLIDTYSTANFYYAVACGWLAKRLGLPYVCILHGGLLPQRLERSPRLSRLLFDSARYNLAPSRYLLEVFRREGYRVEYLPNMVDLGSYPYRARKKVRPRLLYVRAFGALYNPTMAVQVLAALKKEYPETTLCMIGPDKDGTLKEVQRLAEALGVSQSLEVTGRLSREEWVRRSREFDIFINTSNVDNTPVSVIEAMALGLPVVTTDAGGLPWLVEEGKDGLIVPRGDSDAMTDAVRRLIENPKLAERLSDEARKKVEKFDWNHLQERWREILNGCETADRIQRKGFFMIRKYIYLLGERLRNPLIRSRFRELERSDFASLEELRELQLSRLKSLLAHAKKHAPFYAERLKDLDIDAMTLDDLSAIPTLTKQDLIGNRETIQNRPTGEKLIKSETSGSTGDALIFYRTLSWDAYHRAAQLRGYRWYGIEPWEKNIYFWGFNPTFGERIKTRFFDFLVNRYRIFSYSEEELAGGMEILRKCSYMEGYSSAIYMFGNYLKERGKHYDHIKLVKGTSEKIYDNYHRVTKEVFGRKMTSEYGAAEAGIIAFECPEGKMHITMENVIVEEVGGKIVVTNLHSHAFPIVRYELGDYIRISDRPCTCGRQHPVIEEVTGRVGKNIYGKERAYPSLTLYYIFKNIALKRGMTLTYFAQQRQRGVLEIEIYFPEGDEVILREYILHEAEKYFADDMKIEIVFSCDYGRKSKKNKDFVSYLDEESQ